ncbi:hypothetical protein [Epilithonimonas hominis]|uniref:hypothetical protein n=1 Tax=Epilithonimonas hominis TaxID=420404 RepID=UPI00289F0A8A|nr:hypothetical protein [Epilithonimonas hominis]
MSDFNFNELYPPHDTSLPYWENEEIKSKWKEDESFRNSWNTDAEFRAKYYQDLAVKREATKDDITPCMQEYLDSKKK